MAFLLALKCWPQGFVGTCPGAIYIWKNMKTRVEIVLKLTTNGQRDKGFLLTLKIFPKGLSATALGLYTYIKALTYIPEPGERLQDHWSPVVVIFFFFFFFYFDQKRSNMILSRWGSFDKHIVRKHSWILIKSEKEILWIAASDQGLHCLLSGISIKKNKVTTKQ